MNHYEDIVQTFLYVQNNIRLYHWKTMIYSRHIASGDLYKILDPLIDSFIETLQGKIKGNRIHYKPFNLALFELSDENIIEILKKFIDYLNDLEDALSSIKIKTDLLNIRDTMVGHLNQTLYLFTFK